MEKREILVLYGTDPKAMAKRILEQAGLEAMLTERGSGKNIRIGLKPNLVLASPAAEGATTHPEIAAGVIEYLQERGYHNIVIMEGSWVGDRTQAAFRVCGYRQLEKQYSVELIDTKADEGVTCDCAGMKLDICKAALDVDFMINMPVLKGHCQTNITCALKNNKGLIPDSEKRRYHTLGLHDPIGHLNVRVPNDFILVDGICGDLDFEEGGNPVPMNRIIAAADPVLCDTYVCSLLGYEKEEVPYIGIAERLGAGSSDLAQARIQELNKGADSRNKPVFTRRTARLAKRVDARDACSACYGSVIHALARMEEQGVESLPGDEEKICIGQGFRGERGRCGIGNCTSGFDRWVKGCPPRAIDIIEAFCQDSFQGES